MHSTTPRGAWTLIVPLKASARGKSRIDVDPLLRGRLAFAMASDTIVAASSAVGVGVVLVVVEDPEDAERLVDLPGVRVQLTTTTGLNVAIREGLAGLAVDAGPVAVLPGDLPSLTSGELSGALEAASAHRFAVVADRQETGTTLLAAASSGWLRPQYGRESLRRHLAGGAVLLEIPTGSGLRRDVDRVEDLSGVTGRRTLEVLESAGWGPELCEARRTG